MKVLRRKVFFVLESRTYLIYLSELDDFKKRRIKHFKKNLADLAEMEIKHAKVFLDKIPLNLNIIYFKTLNLHLFY